MYDLDKQQIKIFKSLNTPSKIQEFINQIPTNFEENGETCYSPMKVLKENKSHCIEGAILAALILRFNGYKPLIVDLTANKNDYDHVVAVFKKNGKWGAISKSNHAILRYREPVYTSIRELVMSYFHEYINDDGKKTLRSYSLPVNLSKFDNHGWMNSEEDIWYIADYLTKIKHYQILNRIQIAGLRVADKVELEVNKILEWNSNKAKKNF